MKVYVNMNHILDKITKEGFLEKLGDFYEKLFDHEINYAKKELTKI